MLIFFLLATTILSESDFSENLWYNSFADSDGKLEYSCVGTPRKNPAETASDVIGPFEELRQQYPTICSCYDDVRNEELCPIDVKAEADSCGLVCKINCRNQRDPLKCFDNQTGELTEGTGSNANSL
ncbi:Oidioi.mRNA.OKI2018_I69.XSR.g13893.t1.cds [Oikopleura dioica]|uniref:Oidioi.mRNA.OKI2018_I69.XSR.g13893.t1.cds n=1 Tax=Oikopleura dioica TaxID=34765 RepID=A0ABN7SFA9_OIKDI|nr:Oidioi.mRNA.OKI2018_I69.XSR.g13893.t1.cds [Oikopleura dioica]